MVDGFRRDDDDVPGTQHMSHSVNIDGNLPFQVEVEFVVVMGVVGHGLHVDVIIIIKLEVLLQHVLAGLEGRNQVFLHDITSPALCRFRGLRLTGPRPSLQAVFPGGAALFLHEEAVEEAGVFIADSSGNVRKG